MRHALLVLLALSSAACVTPATRPVRDLAPGVIADVTPADRYASRTAAPAELRAAFERSLTPSAQALLRYEPALEGVARAIGDTWSTTTQPPANSVLTWLHWRAGVVGRPAGSRMMRAEGRGSERALDRELERWARQLNELVTAPRAFAVVRFYSSGGEEVQVLALADDSVEVEVPRAVHAGAPLSLKGRIKVPSQKLTLFVEDDERTIRNVPVPLGPKGRFEVSVPGPATAGRRFLELMSLPGPASQTLPWSRSVLLLPLLVDATEPPQAEPELVKPGPNPAEQAAWGPRIRAAWDARRQGLGLPPLRPVDGLDALSGQYAAQLAANPDAPVDPQLVLRVNAAGVVSREVAVHHAQGEFLDELVWLQWRRPAYRVALLSPTPPAHGLALQPREDGTFAYAEIVAQEVGVLDAAAETTALRARFAALRAAAAKPTLATEPKLDSAIAAVVARACKAGEAPPKTELTDALRASGFSGASTWLNYTAARVLPEDLEGAVDDLPTRDATHLSLAVCQFEAGPKKGQELMFVLLVNEPAAKPKK